MKLLKFFLSILFLIAGLFLLTGCEQKGMIDISSGCLETIFLPAGDLKIQYKTFTCDYQADMCINAEWNNGKCIKAYIYQPSDIHCSGGSFNNKYYDREKNSCSCKDDYVWDKKGENCITKIEKYCPGDTTYQRYNEEDGKCYCMDGYGWDQKNQKCINKSEQVDKILDLFEEKYMK